MRIALIGNGAMGQLVAAEAKVAGDEVATIVTSKDRDLNPSQLAERLRGREGQWPGDHARSSGHDVAIDFSVGEAVLRNIEACALAGVPLVEGTTGWKAHEETARQIVNEHSAALVYGALLNLSFWPFARYYPEQIAFLPHAPVATNLLHWWRFDITTSLGFDVPAAIGNVVLVVLVAAPVLTALRRVARRVAFDAPVEFH